MLCCEICGGVVAGMSEFALRSCDAVKQKGKAIVAW